MTRDNNIVLNMCEIDITGLNKVELLHELWCGQKLAGFFEQMSQCAPPFDELEANVAVRNGYIDYFCGRCIKTDLSKDIISPRLYDRDAGDNSFMRAVEKVKFGRKIGEYLLVSTQQWYMNELVCGMARGSGRMKSIPLRYH